MDGQRRHPARGAGGELNDRNSSEADRETEYSASATDSAIHSRAIELAVEASHEPGTRIITIAATTKGIQARQHSIGGDFEYCAVATVRPTTGSSAVEIAFTSEHQLAVRVCALVVVAERIKAGEHPCRRDLEHGAIAICAVI